MSGARTSTLATLRGRIERLEAHGDTHDLNKVALGHAGADAVLRGGLAASAVHEVFAEGHQSATATGSGWSYVVPSNTFTDPNLPAETLTYSATGLPSWMTFNPTNRTFSGTPGPIGSWTITVTATDASGAAVSDSFVVTTANAAPVVASPIADKSVVVNTSWSWQVPTSTFRDYNDAAQVFT